MYIYIHIYGWRGQRTASSSEGRVHKKAGEKNCCASSGKSPPHGRFSECFLCIASAFSPGVLDRFLTLTTPRNPTQNTETQLACIATCRRRDSTPPPTSGRLHAPPLSRNHYSCLVASHGRLSECFSCIACEPLWFNSHTCKPPPRRGCRDFPRKGQATGYGRIGPSLNVLKLPPEGVGRLTHRSSLQPPCGAAKKTTFRLVGTKLGCNTA